MKKYNKFSIATHSKKKFAGEWAFKEGVFLTPQGKYIARIHKYPNNYETLSQHDKKEDALKVYNEYKNKDAK